MASFSGCWVQRAARTLQGYWYPGKPQPVREPKQLYKVTISPLEAFTTSVLNPFTISLLFFPTLWLIFLLLASLKNIPICPLERPHLPSRSLFMHLQCWQHFLTDSAFPFILQNSRQMSAILWGLSWPLGDTTPSSAFSLCPTIPRPSLFAPSPPVGELFLPT